jgi:hypothetical protein
MTYSFESMYIIFCNLLGAKIFKKYWVTGGSYWNETHIDKNDKEDLQGVIKDSWSYSKTHIGGLFLETLLYSLVILLNIQQNSSLSYKIFLLPLILHGYPLLIHNYNRILAKRQIKYLDSISLNVETKNNKIIVSEHNNFFQAKIKNHYYHLGPEFVSLKKANNYVKYLEENYTLEYIMEKIYLGEEKELYKNFIKN